MKCLGSSRESVGWLESELSSGLIASRSCRRLLLRQGDIDARPLWDMISARLSHFISKAQLRGALSKVISNACESDFESGAGRVHCIEMCPAAIL